MRHVSQNLTIVCFANGDKQCSVWERGGQGAEGRNREEMQL